MTAFVLYGVPGSPYVRSALLGLAEKAAEHSLVALPLGELRSAGHLARNPFGRVPVLEHGDFRLYETQAILHYLDALLPEPALRPAEPRAAARMQQLAGIVDWYFFPQVAIPIGFERIIKPALGRTADDAVVARALPQAAICLDEIGRLMADAPYLCGETPSIADLMLAPQLAYVAATPEGEALLAERPRLAGWLQRMGERPSMRRTRLPHLRSTA